MPLPTNIAGSYPDRGPGDAAHQEHHDAIHAAVNEVTEGRLSVSGLSATFAGQGKARGNGLRWLGKAADAINAGTPTQVKWLAFGDSMAGMKINALKPHLLAMFGGYAGHIMDSFITNNATVGTVSQNTTDYANWVTGATTEITAGGSRTWGVSGGSPTCDTIHVFYANDGGGTFKVQIDGTDETGYTNVGTSGTGLGVITLSKTLAPHNVTVTALTGTVTVIGVGFVDSTISGLVPVDVSWGGMELADGLNAVTNLGGFLAAVDPTVFAYEMRETDWAGLPPRLDTLLDAVTTNAPQTDLIGWGAPWDGRAEDPTNVAVQNGYVREAFEARGGAYWDGNTITPDHATIAALGWGSDPIHPAAALSEFYAPLIIRDLGIDYEGMPSAKRVDTDLVTVTDALAFAGKDRNAPEAVMEADATGNDLTFKGARWLRFFDSAGGTEYARFVMNLLTEGWIPPRMAVGQGNALVWGEDASTLAVRRNGSASNYANLRVRAVRQQWSILSVSGAVSVDFTNAGLQILTMTGNVTSMSFTGGAGFEEVEVHLIQDATGSRTLAGAGGGSIKWAGGAAPTLTTTPGRRDIFKFRYQSGSWWETSRNMNVG